MRIYFFATNQILQIQRMSENNESVTQNAGVAFQLRALCQQLELLFLMYMDVIDDLKSIRKQNIGANCKGRSIRPYRIPDLILKRLLMKTQMRVKVTVMVIWSLKGTHLIVKACHH